MNPYTWMRKYLFLSILLLVAVTFFYFHLYDYFTFDTLKTYQTLIQSWTIEHYKSAVAIYILLFAIMIACTIPCATFFTLLGGFLFGSIAIVYAIFSTTLGGLILFLAVRTAIGSSIATKHTGWIKSMEQGFQKNAFHYLLSLRLMPIFPCWISNIAAGALNVPLKTFLSATILGILPATIIYVMAGRSLDTLLADKNLPLLNVMFNPSVFFPLLGLAFLSLFPVIYKYIKKYTQKR
jgi:uncharacterized membrane protein YdjX (TVP38/TMEM64 family)